LDLQLEIYEQCNEHLRETDKKRDQLAGFFAAIVGVVFANIQDIPADNRPFILAGLGVLGLFVMLSIIQYRKWHILYVHCIQALTIIISSNAKSNKDVLSRVKEKFTSIKYRSSLRSRINPFDSAEASIFYVITFICFVPWQLLISGSTGILACPQLDPILSSIIDYAIFELCVLIISEVVLYRAVKTNPLDSWILLGLDYGK